MGKRFIISKPLAVMPFGAFGIFDNGKPIFKTKAVGYLGKSLAASLKIPKLSCTIKRGGIEDNMIMDMRFVNVGGNDKSVVAFGEAHAEFIADFISKLRGYFPGLKGLPYLIGNDIACLFSACNIIILPLR